MPEPIVISNGASLSLQPTDSGFAHGYGLFESIRLEGGRLRFWSAHWQRLQNSATALGLNSPQSEESILRAIGRLVSIDALENATIKLSLLRKSQGDQLFVYARPSINWPETIRLSWRPDYPLSAHSLIAGHKTHNYMENIYLLEQARSAGFDDCLRPASCGSLGETAVANILWFSQGVLHTPAIHLGILPGVVRAALLRLADLLKISVSEGAYSPDCLHQAEALYMTNASLGIHPVHSVDGEGLSVRFESAGHPLYNKLREALQVELEQEAIQPPVPEIE